MAAPLVLHQLPARLVLKAHSLGVTSIHFRFESVYGEITHEVTLLPTLALHLNNPGHKPREALRKELADWAYATFRYDARGWDPQGDTLEYDLRSHTITHTHWWMDPQEEVVATAEMDAPPQPDEMRRLE